MSVEKKERDMLKRATSNVGLVLIYVGTNPLRHNIHISNTLCNNKNKQENTDEGSERFRTPLDGHKQITAAIKVPDGSEKY